MWYEVYVFGMDLADVESEGGWQRYIRTNVESRSREVYEELFFKIGSENVMYMIDGEEVEYDWDTEDNGYYDNCHCDTYGICGGTSCPQYFSCHA